MRRGIKYDPATNKLCYDPATSKICTVTCPPTCQECASGYRIVLSGFDGHGVVSANPLVCFDWTDLNGSWGVYREADCHYEGQTFWAAVRVHIYYQGDGFHIYVVYTRPGFPDADTEIEFGPLDGDCPPLGEYAVLRCSSYAYGDCIPSVCDYEDDFACTLEAL